MFCSVCFPAQEVPSEKGSTLKGKNLLLKGSKFFSFGVDTFSEGGKNNLTELTSPKVDPFILDIQSNFDGSNPFGTMKFCSRQLQFEPRKATISGTPGGTMETIVGYLFGVLYFKCMLCVLIRITSQRQF